MSEKRSRESFVSFYGGILIAEMWDRRPAPDLNGASPHTPAGISDTDESGMPTPCPKNAVASLLS
ncbi:hypothetical protein, partial [Fretibacterium sp. OH1220_COT-178]|uniref:hypothetical protein n=1 Tax=Fretibacterium sp. OH1220_COT-178 TaxID=2491047 RepID=UPI001F4524F3